MLKKGWGLSLKSSSIIKIDHISDLNLLLERHPYIRDRPEFERYYNLAKWYIVIKNLQTTNHKHHKGTRNLPKHLSEKTGLSPNTIYDWITNKAKPKLFQSLRVHEHARRQWEASLSTEAKNRCLNPSTIYKIFKPFHKNPEKQTPTEIANAIEQLYATKPNPSIITFAELQPYQRTGPRWLREIAKTIQKNRLDIESTLNQRMNLSPNKTLQISLVNDTLYLRQRDNNPDNWLNIYKDEHFVFHNPEDITKLLAQTRSNLHLDSSKVKLNRGLSRLITQLTEKPDTFRPSEIEHYRKYVIGRNLHVLLDATNKSLEDIKPLISHVGRTREGRGGIRNPRFPGGNKLDEFKARAIAIVASDGHINRRTDQLVYMDKERNRVQYVKQLFYTNLGEIYIPKASNDTLIMPPIVGRVFKKWGIPKGAKHLQEDFRLPSSIREATPKIKRAYIQEVIPEDGTFFIQRGYGRFQIKRVTVLDAGPQGKLYNFKPKINVEHKELIRKYGKPSLSLSRNLRRSVVVKGKLEKIAKESNDEKDKRLAMQLLRIIQENPCRLLDDETDLVKGFKINMNKRVSEIFLYESGRVSYSTIAQTSGKEAAFRWAILASPASGIKRERVNRWLNAHEEKAKAIRKKLRQESLLSTC